MQEESIIVNKLKDIGFNFKHIGTIYLIETIKILNQDKDLIENIERNVYTEIAKKYKKKATTIKSDIIKATDYMYTRNAIEDLNKYFPNNAYEKITPKMVINTILIHIKTERSSMELP